MRHLFVPACLGLLTWGSAIGPELSLANLPPAAPPSVADESDVVIVPMPAQRAAARDAVLPLPASLALPYADQYEIPDPVAEPVPAVLRALKPIVKPIIPRTRAEICETLTGAAHSNDLPAPFFIRLLYQESSFRPGTVSGAGAEGIAQFMPETSADRGLDNPYDPVQAIAAAARLLRDLVQRFGNLGLAAAAYNAGPKRIQDWLAKKGHLPQETKDYVKSITGRPAENWTAAENGSPAIKVQRDAPCQQAAGLLAWNGPDQIPLPPTRDVAHPDAPPTAHANAPTAAHENGGKRNMKVGPAAAKSPLKDPHADDAAAKSTGKDAAARLTTSKHDRRRLYLSER
jgi:soluble lytic murein transglycosylase-like protein